jgi:pimeloyl-ACP methyl ester carboxylesterase
MGLTIRGHGSSSKNLSGYSLETLVKDIVAFVDAVGPKRVVLVGHSFGGLEIPLASGRLGDRSAGLVFLDAVYDWPAIFDSTAAKVTGMFEVPDTLMNSRQALEDWYRRRDPSTWNAAQEATLRSQTYLKSDGHLGWQMPDELNRRISTLAGVPAAYSEIKVPTLVLWANQTEPGAKSMTDFGFSAADVATWREWASVIDVRNKKHGIEALQKYVPDATIVEVPAPHTLHWYAPAPVIELMNGFLNRLPPAGATR